MKFICDFHIHSKYSRATSQAMNPEELDKWAKMKGIKVMATGDFTHPLYFKELKEKLVEKEPGLYIFKKTKEKDPTRFILTVEISNIYSKNGKVRKVHNLVFAPSLGTAEKINNYLSMIGNLKADGRPILGLDSKEMLKKLLDISPDILLVPAHCLLPDTVIHVKDNFLAKVQDIKEGDLVFTHKGRWRRVKKVLTRPYKGKVLSIKPYYFRLGLTATPEHPFFAIKTKKNCHWSKGFCRPSHESNPSCTKKYYKNYQPTWIPAAALEKGDVLVFPRFLNGYSNHAFVNVKEVATKEARFSSATHVWGPGTRTISIPRRIPVTKEFCRLAGYFLSEGYVNGRDAIGFTFSSYEKEYANDVAMLINQIFGVGKPNHRFLHGEGMELTFYSKIIQEFFAKLFYSSRTHSAATKAMPLWMLGLPVELQAEIFKGWWRGDRGYTVSRTLMNQIKIILLRLGIIPSIYKTTKDSYARQAHYIGNRKIKANHDIYAMTGLTFFEDKLGFLCLPEFRRLKRKSKVRHGWVDENYVYLPIRDIEEEKYKGEVYNLEVKEDNSYISEFATVHNCWTPWFAIFGSMSGFDSIEECFEDYSKYIYAIETGLSSDPSMNWRFSALDKVALISNSDSHSAPKIGREANVFDTILSYKGIIEAIKAKDPKKFLYTIEFFPEEGKYHYDGHRLCKVCLNPKETIKQNFLCPKCRRPVTVGVMHRVEKLADRPEGFKPENAVPFKNLIPLEEIIADALEVGVASKKVKELWQALVNHFGNEFFVLLEASQKEIEAVSLPEIAEGIIRVREGKVKISPGYDGEYGKISIFDSGERKELAGQKSLF